MAEGVMENQTGSDVASTNGHDNDGNKSPTTTLTSNTYNYEKNGGVGGGTLKKQSKSSPSRKSTEGGGSTKKKSKSRNEFALQVVLLDDEEFNCHVDVGWQHSSLPD